MLGNIRDFPATISGGVSTSSNRGVRQIMPQRQRKNSGSPIMENLWTEYKMAVKKVELAA